MAASGSASPSSSPDDTRRSGIVFTGLLMLVLLAVSFPEMATQGLLGILWTGAGLLMVLFPPVARVPRLWSLLATGFVLFSLVGFLPRGWFHVSSWRTDLEALGLDTGAHAFVQLKLAAEAAVGFIVTACVVLFMLGHRIEARYHHRLALGFALGVGAWTAVALVLHDPAGPFGFFPNRNHTATLLAMGTFAGLGSLAHAIRRKDSWKVGLAVIPTVLCLYALFAVSISRAGVVLVIVGFVLWILLAGFKQLHGNVGRALVLVLVAVSGYFMIVDSTAKKRLASTVDRVVASEPDAGSSAENPFAESEGFRLDASSDGRITIFQDTLSMVGKESWTGVGPGQFSYVFPQHREKTNASSDARCFHPESDWLMMLAEIGWPATLCLVAGVVAVFSTAFRQAKRGRARFLRTGCIVAALLLCIHGIFDVPGHRVGLAWAAALLLAMSLRQPAELGLEPGPALSRFSSYGWRGLGVLLALAGGFLLHAQWAERDFLPSVEVRQGMSEAKSLYAKDQVAYARALAAGQDYQPLPWEDPIETALQRTQQAIDVAPLDPYIHHVRGALALHYDDKQEIARKAFAIQRRLDPNRVNVGTEQARAWSKQDSGEVMTLWQEALRRASREQSRTPESVQEMANTFQRILQTAGGDEVLVLKALELAGQDPSRLLIWAQSAPAKFLDREMPRLLTGSLETVSKNQLFEIWGKRGSGKMAAAFATDHPELGLTPP